MVRSCNIWWHFPHVVSPSWCRPVPARRRWHPAPGKRNTARIIGLIQTIDSLPPLPYWLIGKMGCRYANAISVVSWLAVSQLGGIPTTTTTTTTKKQGIRRSKTTARESNKEMKWNKWRVEKKWKWKSLAAPSDLCHGRLIHLLKEARPSVTSLIFQRWKRGAGNQLGAISEQSVSRNSKLELGCYGCHLEAGGAFPKELKLH